MSTLAIHPQLSRAKSNRALNKSLRDLSGTWKLSKSLSAGVPPALAIQGFDSRTRRAIIAAPITLFISQSNYPSQIFVKQSSSVGFAAACETERWYPPQRSGQWSEWSETKGGVHGDQRRRSRWVRGDGFEHDEGIGYLTDGLARSGEFLEAEVECESLGWHAVQVWYVDRGRLIRRVVTLAKDERRAETRLVYEYEG